MNILRTLRLIIIYDLILEILIQRGLLNKDCLVLRNLILSHNLLNFKAALSITRLHVLILSN